MQPEDDEHVLKRTSRSWSSLPAASQSLVAVVCELAMSEMSGLRDIRVSRLKIRLMASRLLPFKSGAARHNRLQFALAVLNARPWVARGLPSLLLDVASPTPHAGGARPSLERGWSMLHSPS